MTTMFSKHATSCFLYFSLPIPGAPTFMFFFFFFIQLLVCPNHLHTSPKILRHIDRGKLEAKGNSMDNCYPGDFFFSSLWVLFFFSHIFFLKNFSLPTTSFSYVLAFTPSNLSLKF